MLNTANRQAGKAKSPRYAGLLAFLAPFFGFGLGCGCGSGALVKNTRAMSSIDGMEGLRSRGFVAMSGV
jgi:hypothetical protein